MVGDEDFTTTRFVGAAVLTTTTGADVGGMGAMVGGWRGAASLGAIVGGNGGTAMTGAVGLGATTGNFRHLETH